MSDEDTHALSRDLTSYSFSKHYSQRTFFLKLRLYIVGVTLQSVPGTIQAKNYNFAQIKVCAPLKMLQETHFN